MGRAGDEIHIQLLEVHGIMGHGLNRIGMEVRPMLSAQGRHAVQVQKITYLIVGMHQ